MNMSARTLTLIGFAFFLAGAFSGSYLTSLWLANARGEQGAIRSVTNPGPAQDDVPGEELQGLPRFPGSTRVEYRNSVYGDIRVTEVEYVTTAESVALRDFLRQVFVEHGWTIVDSGFLAGEWSFVVVAGDREAVVELEEPRPLVNYEIKLTEPYHHALDDTLVD